MADERGHGGALQGSAVNLVLIDETSRPALSRGFRLQWEAAQNCHVLLYPEGMIKLNGSAGEIMKRCDGNSTIAAITADLERAFTSTGLSADVIGFVRMAVEKVWLQIHP